MIRKFPFDDNLMKDLGILQLENTDQYSPGTVVSLARPQLGISYASSLDKLRFPCF